MLGAPASGEPRVPPSGGRKGSPESPGGREQPRPPSWEMENAWADPEPVPCALSWQKWEKLDAVEMEVTLAIRTLQNATVHGVDNHLDHVLGVLTPLREDLLHCVSSSPPPSAPSLLRRWPQSQVWVLLLLLLRHPRKESGVQRPPQVWCPHADLRQAYRFSRAA